MKTKNELQPKIYVSQNHKYQIYFWYNDKRYRYSNGSVISEPIYPNHVDLKNRHREANLLRSAFALSIRKGWRPQIKAPKKPELLIGNIAKVVLERKMGLEYSLSYKSDLIRTERLWSSYISKKYLSDLTISHLSIDIIADFIYTSALSPQSKRNLKRNISALLKDELESNGTILNFRRIKLPSKGQELHKPIKDVSALLTDIKSFNENLFLCCLMTYTMLLRPHREIRSIKFSDFNEDFTVLSLSGSRVKSKRNRVLPVPKMVRNEVLERLSSVSCRDANLFSKSTYDHHRDYFKGLWTKYKKRSNLLSEKQTLYSFRHTGAIRVFEKTGSLQKLQQVMGHSDMKVSLTYLRGLEVKQLDVEDLPELNRLSKPNKSEVYLED